MYFCGHYVLSNGLNGEDFSIISTFGVIFGQNLGFWPPRCLFGGVSPNCYAIDIEYTESRFILNVFLWLFYVI
jgi:hypothetical protein